MEKGYHVINGYRMFRIKGNGVEKLRIEFLENGSFFTQTTLEGEITEEKLETIRDYLDTTFEKNDGTGAGALITILYYVQTIFQE